MPFQFLSAGRDYNVYSRGYTRGRIHFLIRRTLIRDRFVELMSNETKPHKPMSTSL